MNTFQFLGIPEAHFTIINNNLKKLKALIQKEPTTILSLDSNNNNLLHTAILYDRLSIIKYLLTFPSLNINHINNNNETPLDLSLQLNDNYNHKNILQLLNNLDATQATPIPTQLLSDIHIVTKTKEWQKQYDNNLITFNPNYKDKNNDNLFNILIKKYLHRSPNKIKILHDHGVKVSFENIKLMQESHKAITDILIKYYNEDNKVTPIKKVA